MLKELSLLDIYLSSMMIKLYTIPENLDQYKSSTTLKPFVP